MKKVIGWLFKDSMSVVEVAGYLYITSLCLTNSLWFMLLVIPLWVVCWTLDSYAKS